MRSFQVVVTAASDRPTFGCPATTPANGAGAAVGVVTAATLPPLNQANRRRADTLIHSPCQSPRASGSMIQTRPRLRS